MKVATVFALLLVSANAFTAPQFATRAVGAPKKKAAPKKAALKKKAVAKKPIMTKIKSAQVRSVELCFRNGEERFNASCVFYGVSVPFLTSIVLSSPVSLIFLPTVLSACFVFLFDEPGKIHE